MFVSFFSFFFFFFLPIKQGHCVALYTGDQTRIVKSKKTTYSKHGIENIDRSSGDGYFGLRQLKITHHRRTHHRRRRYF